MPSVIGLLPQALAPFYNTAQSPALQLPGVTVGPLTFYPLQFVDNDHAMQVTITNTQSNGSPPNDTADVIVTFGPPPSSPLSGYGSVAETYRSVSDRTFPVDHRVPTTTLGKPTPITF